MKEHLFQAWQHLVGFVFAMLPKLALGLVFLAVGLLLAKVLESLLRTLLVRIKFDSIVQRAGIDKALQKIGLREQLDHFLPRLAYFLFLILLLRTASDALGLAAISDTISAFFNYLPNIIAALLLLILGSSVGSFAGQSVTRMAEDAGIEFAPALGRMVSGLILFFVGVMAVSQLKIDTTMVRLASSFVMGAFALAFGLAFGLGSREIVRNIIAGFYARKFLQIGKPLEIAGQRGILKAMTSTHTILEQDQTDISISNAVFLEQVAKQ